MSSYSRPGVAAAVRLAGIKDRKVWERTACQYKPMLLEKKKGKELVSMDEWCEKLSEKLQSETSPSISKKDLVKIIEWKFAKQRPRPYMKKILANTDKQVKDCSKLAFAEAQDGDIDQALNEITKLQGVGVAGASAILSLHRPDLVAFMDDEVIESLYDGKRAYTKEIYNIVNERCCKLAKMLGADWTPRRVGMSLWTAALISACEGEDLTLIAEGECCNDSPNKETALIKRKVKRRRKS